MRILLFSVAFFLLGNLVLAQETSQKYFKGYAEEISGKRFTYHSPFPDVKSALIMRGRADFKPISWKTEVVPASYQEKYISFIWVYSMDTDPEPVPFILHVNGKEWFRFTSPLTSEIGTWGIKGRKGAELKFNVTMLDKFDDEMGFAILTLPISAVERGEAAVLEISAEPVQDNSWFMTYKTGVTEQIDIYQNMVVVKDRDQLLHSLSVDLINLGDETPCEIQIEDQRTSTILKAGYNHVEIKLPKVNKPTDITVSIQIEGHAKVEKRFTMSPVKEWEIFLVQHTHSDIGYTRPQTEILPEHLRYIDHALDYCDQTDDYPDASKFRWTCETSWSVREYLRSRPQSQVDRLLKRIREGRIEATGMFFNFSELVDEPALVAQTKTLKMMKNAGIDVTTAMQNDVNGIAWCLVDYFHHTDVKYLTMGIHAHRARKPFNKPTSFWWQSPAGNRLLAYRSEHYMHGNALSLTSGQQDVFRANLSSYLSGLEDKGYPYKKLSLQFSGYLTDNSPPSPKVCDIIREWNDSYEWPKLRSSLAKDFMIYLDETHADDIPMQEVAWPDWWTDGVASAANETGVARATHVEISVNTGAFSMARLMGIPYPKGISGEIEAIYDNLLFYDEHTFGAAESVRDPLVKNSVNQWNMKSANIWSASKQSSQLQEKALAHLEEALEKSAIPTIAVFNTLNWERSGMVELFIPYEVIPSGSDYTILDSDGKEVPAQVFRRLQEGAYYGLWVSAVPAMGYRTLLVTFDQEAQKRAQEEIKQRRTDKDLSLENDFYRLNINLEKGIISELYDKELKKELLDPEDTLSMGQLIYEQLSNRHDLERLTNTNRDTVYRPLELKRTLPSNVGLTGSFSGPIYESIFLNGILPVCADERGLDIEIRLYHHQKKIELHYKMVKLAVFEPEGVYVAFPFKLEDGKLSYEAQGGIVQPGVNQLAGSASDWNTIQNFAAVNNHQSQIVFTSREAPLVQFGAINTGRYYYRLKPQTNHIFSWVLNNYWVTNFKASQEGELNWSYSLSSSGNPSRMFATKFGWGERVPMLSRIILPTFGAENREAESRSLLTLDDTNLLLVNASPSMDGRGIILHLREVEGGHAMVDIRHMLEETGASSIQEVNVLEEELQTLTSPLLIEHYETKFLKLSFGTLR